VNLACLSKSQKSNCNYIIRYSLNSWDTVMLGFLDVYPLAFFVNRVTVISESSVLSKNITALPLLN
jgi:hypothetical protein